MSLGLRSDVITEWQSQHPEGPMGSTSADPAGLKSRVPVLSPAPGLRNQMHRSPLFHLPSIKCMFCCIPWISWFVTHSIPFYNQNLSFFGESFEELHKSPILLDIWPLCKFSVFSCSNHHHHMQIILLSSLFSSLSFIHEIFIEQRLTHDTWLSYSTWLSERWARHGSCL